MELVKVASRNLFKPHYHERKIMIICKNYNKQELKHIPFAKRERHKPNTNPKGHIWLERRKSSDRFIMKHERSWII